MRDCYKQKPEQNYRSSYTMTLRKPKTFTEVYKKHRRRCIRSERQPKKYRLSWTKTTKEAIQEKKTI